MWKIQFLIASSTLVALAIARPQSFQIEKQVVIEIPYGAFENGLHSKQTPIVNVLNKYFSERNSIESKKVTKGFYNKEKLVNLQKSLNFMQTKNDQQQSLPSYSLFNKFQSKEPYYIQRRMSEESSNDFIENLTPPSEDAPIILYSKPIKSVLEKQLKKILAEYKNLPKSNSLNFENVINYEMKLRDEQEKEPEKQLILDDESNIQKQGRKSKGRSQKSMGLVSSTEQPNDDEVFTSNENFSNMFVPQEEIQPADILERYVLKKGGIAIVGPKGIATAERGGTAIVGPNGVAYTKPNGTAIVGPGSRVVSLPVDVDLNKLVYELYRHQSKHPEKLTAEGIDGQFVLNSDGSTIKEVFLPVGGKIVATGPAIYHDIQDSNNVAVIRLTNSPQVIGLPYYGGAKGQFLQITTDQNGAILNQAIVPEAAANYQPNTLLYQQDGFAVKQQFAQSFDTLQNSAKKLIDLQQKVRKTGQFQDTDRLSYSTNLALLGQSASQLAQLQGQDGQDLAKFFAAPPSQNVNRQSATVEDEDVGEEPLVPDDENAAITTDDSVTVDGPPDTASVAEAKPLGVAIAGEGGVASSKPSATAIVGPGGLAIARPVATAISGVDPSKVGLGSKFPISRNRDRVDSKLANRVN